MPVWISDTLLVLNRVENGATYRIYPENAPFTTFPPVKGTPFPVSGSVATGTTGPHNGSDGAIRAQLSPGNYHVGVEWDGGVYWKSFSVNPSGGATNTATYYGATDDGTVNSRNAIQNLINAMEAAGGGDVILDGAFGLASPLILPATSQVNLIGQGGTRLVSLMTTGGSGSAMVCVSGAITSTTTALSANAPSGTDQIAVNSATALTTGDVLLLRDNTYKYGTSGRNQEFVRVRAKSSNTLTLERRLIGSYTTAQSAEVVKILTGGPTIRGITFEVPTGKRGGAVYARLCDGLVIENCHSTGNDGWPAFRFDNCERSEWRDCTGKHPVDPSASDGTPYQFVGNDCRHCRGIGLYTERDRESTWSNNSRHCEWVNCLSRSPYNAGWDAHGTGCEHISFVNCAVEHSRDYGFVAAGNTAQIGDKHLRFINCRAISCGNHGISAVAPDGQTSEGLTILGCEVLDCGRTNAQAAGILVSRYRDFVVEGNRLNGAGNTIALYGIQISQASGGVVLGNRLDNFATRGIAYTGTVHDVSFDHNKLNGIGGPNFFGSGVNAKVRLRFNDTDDSTNTFVGGEERFENSFDTLSTIYRDLIVNGSLDVGDTLFVPHTAVARLEGNVYLHRSDGTSTIHSSGSVAYSVASLSASGTLGVGHSYLTVNATDRAVMLTLPPAAGCPGRSYTLAHEGSTAFKSGFRPTSGEAIDGDTDKVYHFNSAYAAATVWSDGTRWRLGNTKGTVS